MKKSRMLAGLVLLLAGCAAGDGAAVRDGVVYGSYFAMPAENTSPAGEFPDPERCFNGAYSSAWEALALPAIRGFADFFAARDIYFAVLVYPDPWEVAAGVLAGENRIPNSSIAVRRMSDCGINALDPLPEIMNIRSGRLWFYYDRFADPHPDVPVQEAAARVLAADLRRRLPGLPEGDPGRYSATLRPSLSGRRDPVSGEEINDELLLLDGGLVPLRAPESPVLIIGNSLCATPSGNELAARLGRELGFPPDLIRVDGHGTARAMAGFFTPGREGVLTSRRAVILAVGYNQLFERWTTPEEVNVRRSAELRPLAETPPEVWQKRRRSQEVSDGFAAWLSRSWRSAGYLNDEERAARDEWRRSGVGLADMPVLKNTSAGSRWIFPDVEAAPGAERLAEVRLFTSAPPGYVNIYVSDGAGGEFFRTVNTSYGETVAFPIPDGVSEITVTAEIMLPEKIIAMGALVISGRSIPPES